MSGDKLQPLRELLPWMEEKIDAGKGTWARDGDGCYFLDFETLKYYSPWDDVLMGEEDREFEYVESAYYKRDLLCKTDSGAILDISWVEAYESYLAEKELLEEE